MSASYSVTLQNQTDSTWTLVVYITLPASVGLQSVSWKQSAAPRSGSTSVSWTDETDACIGTATSFSGSPGFTQNQALAANPGTAWKIVTQSGVAQLIADGNSLTPPQIQITNSSGFLANPAFGMSGVAAVYRPSLQSGLSVQFMPQPQYWMMLAEQISTGELITVTSTLQQLSTTRGAFTPPQQLNFPNGKYAATVTAAMNGNVMTVTITYP